MTRLHVALQLVQVAVLALALGLLIAPAPAPEPVITWRTATPAESLRWAMQHP
jgi:hypothetical protein